MTQSTAKARITLSFEAKLGEMEFFLNMIESEWKATVLEYTQNGQIKDLSYQNKINYYFSGFSNSFQSTKDVLHSITGAAPWSVFYSIKNFAFIKNSRNAITHDGLQLISTFQDGRYFVVHAGGSLKRYDEKQKEVEIPCPPDDIVIICHEFYAELLAKIKEIIVANPSPFEVSNQEFSAIAEETIKESSVIPEFVKEMLKNNPTLISDATAAMGQHDSSSLIEKINERISKVNQDNT